MYQIRKGWPAESAIDEVAKAAAGQTIEEGMIVTLANGEASAANFIDAADPTDGITGFVIAKDDIVGGFTALVSPAVIEVDSAHYAVDTYAPGDHLTAVGGKFAKAASGETVIARVLAVDANNHLRVLWHAVA
jgi:hypothetical protein